MSLMSTAISDSRPILAHASTLLAEAIAPRALAGGGEAGIKLARGLALEANTAIFPLRGSIGGILWHGAETVETPMGRAVADALRTINNQVACGSVHLGDALRGDASAAVTGLAELRAAHRGIGDLQHLIRAY